MNCAILLGAPTQRADRKMNVVQLCRGLGSITVKVAGLEPLYVGCVWTSASDHKVTVFAVEDSLSLSPLT